MAALFLLDARCTLRTVRRGTWCAIAAVPWMLAAHPEAQAAWEAREAAPHLRQSPPPAYLGRADALYARLVTRAIAAPKARGEALPATGSRRTDESATPAPVTATAAAPGQAGYVHYFLIRKPDGVAEMQVGIELPDQTIAWAFPSIGVSVSTFIESDTVAGADGIYDVTHLFGIRPFPDDDAMASLAAALPVRVMPWIEDGVQHCDLDPPPREACVSCLGFVLRILFPAPFPAYPALPADFRQARTGERYTTEDLLIYLTGLHRLATREARVGRIHALDMPEKLREELLRVVSSDGTVMEQVDYSKTQGRARRTIDKNPAPRARPPRRLSSGT